MPLQTTGPISASDIRDEFGADPNSPFLFGEYYRDTTVIDTTPTYTLIRTNSESDEGGSVAILLSTTFVANGTSVPYTITGVSSSDIDVPLTGSFVVGSSSTINITFTEDETLEGPETLTLALDNGEDSITVNVNDTSTAPPTISLDTEVTPVVINGCNSLLEVRVSDYVNDGETLIIPADWHIWSDNTSTAALTIDRIVTIINNGKIMGRGGDYGQDGGPAIVNNTGVNIDIINNAGAYIAGGGGGGGGRGGGGAGGGNGAPGYRASVGVLSGGVGGAVCAAGTSAQVAYSGGNGGGGQGGGAGGGGGGGSTWYDPSYGGGGGGGRILPGTGGAGGTGDPMGPVTGGAGGDAGNSGGSSSNGGGGGWGAAGGNGGGAGGAACSGGNITVQNSGTIYGAIE